LLAGAVGVLVLAVVKGPDWGWDDQRVIAAGLVAAALAIVFVRRSARHPAPLLDGALAWLECDVEATYAGGDHTVFLGRVRWVELGAAGGPLLYFGGGYRPLEDP